MPSIILRSFRLSVFVNVLEVSDSQSDGIYPLIKGIPESTISSDSNQSSSLNIQPGENEFTFKVQVIFELK